MKLTKSQLKQIIKEELQKTVLQEQNDECGPKPVWPGDAAASIKMDPTKKVLADQRAWYNCKRNGKALPRGYPFAQQNRKKKQKISSVVPNRQQRSDLGYEISEIQQTISALVKKTTHLHFRIPTGGGGDSTLSSAVSGVNQELERIKMILWRKDKP